MEVDVEDCHAGGRLAQRLGGDRRIVEEAEAARDIGEGVVARRTAQRICRRRSGQDRFRRLHRRPGAPASAIEGFGRDRAGRVGHVVSGLAHRRRRITAVARNRVNIRNDLGRCSFDAPPARENVLQEIEIFGRVHGCYRAQAEIPWPLDLAARRLRAYEQSRDPCRRFGVGLLRPAGQESLRVMPPLLFREKCLHLVSSLGKSDCPVPGSPSNRKFAP